MSETLPAHPPLNMQSVTRRAAVLAVLRSRHPDYDEATIDYVWREYARGRNKELSFALDECVIAADAAMQAYHEATTPK